MKNLRYAQSVRIRLNKNKKKATIICFEDPMPNFPWFNYLPPAGLNLPPSKQEEQVSEEKSNPDTVKSASAEPSLPEEGRLNWDVDNPDSIMEACYKFLSMRKSGYTFYRLVGEDGSRLYVYDFDQNYPNLFFSKDKSIECRIGTNISI